MGGQKPLRFSLFLLTIVLVAGQTACFDLEPPIAEEVALVFNAEGGVQVEVTVRLANPKSHFQSNPKAKDRIREAQLRFKSGQDQWSRSFDEITWDREWQTWERENDELVWVNHGGFLKDGSMVREFLAHLFVNCETIEGEDYAELTIYPETPYRATQQQRDSLEGRMDAWYVSMAESIAAVEELYGYLEEHPERARTLIGNFFDDLLTPDVKESLEELTPDEKALLDSVGSSLGEVLKVIEVTNKEAYSADELSRLVYDPLPAPFSIEVPGKILAMEGFTSAGRNRVAHRGIGLWESFKGLEGRWYSPDLLLVYVPYLTGMKDEEKDPFDLDGFLAKPRRTSPPPSEREVRREIEKALSPIDLFRVRWARTEP